MGYTEDVSAMEDNLTPIYDAYRLASDEATEKWGHMPLTFDEWLEGYVAQHEAMKSQLEALSDSQDYRLQVKHLVWHRGGIYNLISVALEEMRPTERVDFNFGSLGSDASVFLAKAVWKQLRHVGHIFGWRPAEWQ